MKTAQRNFYAVQKNGLTINIPGRTRTACFLQFLLFFGISILLINLPHSAFAQSPDPLLQKLDFHYYYPSQLGPKKLTARVRWLQKDLGPSQPKFISHPEVLFSWNVESDARVFRVDSDRKVLSEVQREEIENFFQNYREVILPRRLSQTLSDFKFNGTEKGPSQTTVEYRSLQEQDEIKKYILEIDSKHGRISKFGIERKTPPGT